MAVQKSQVEAVVKKFRRSELDTGSSEVQVALMTLKINEMTEHFKVHKKDVSSRKGLVRLVNQRRKLLDYMRKTNPDRYTKVIGELGIRK